MTNCQFTRWYQMHTIHLQMGLYEFITICTIVYRKLSYCCDSRSHCMQYFNAIRSDRNISNLDLWIKNPFAVSPRIQQLLRICVRIRSTHTSAARFTARDIVDKRAVRLRLLCLRVACVHRHLWPFSLRFLWCVLWLNDTYYSKSVWRDE